MAHVVVFTGEYDLANKQGLRRDMRRLDSSDDLVLDLTKVTYIDATFIAELIVLEKARRARKFARTTVVTPANSAVRRVFEVCGVTSIIGLIESYNGACVEASDSVIAFAASGDSLDVLPEMSASEQPA